MGGVGGGGGGGACATHAWGPWSACSVTCGPGRASRQRQYMWPARAHAEACRVPLTDYTRCHGPRQHCRAPSEYEPPASSSTGPCALSAWSAWSPCEGCGVRARTRHYLAPRAHKRCHLGYRARAATSQAMPCDNGPCEKPAKYVNATNHDWFFVDQPSWPCKVTPWGDWSPCSSRCGRGRRLRTRLYLVQDARAQPELSRRLLLQWNKRFAELQKLDFPSENLTVVDPEIDKLVQDQLEQCQFTLSLQEALCDGDDNSCVDTEKSQAVCNLPLAVGHCRGYEERWFYDKSHGACEPFGFTGCGGNGNNFRTRDQCQHLCGNLTTVSDTFNITNNDSVSQSDVTVKKLKPTPPAEDNEVLQNDEPAQGVGVKCKLGPWLGWSECFGECDFGVKLNYRLVKNKSLKPGDECKKLVKSRSCKPAYCRRHLANVVNSSINSTRT